ncbi:hypothetical protein AB4Y72_16355 [Arthrobacter sp. YAF34]|uniref:hypothetical protein n=1 Tax=Arthrobacter sp. YAF34 TaxID=3233083 RepID=UPI003F8E5AC8
MPLSPIPAPGDPAEDRYDGLPASWSASAKETYVQISEENPGLDAASLSTLYEACSLFALADAMAETVAADGFMVPGSQGQPTAHPLLGEIRLCRVQAMAALKALGIAQNQSAASKAGAALAAKRHHGRTPGVRAAK